MSGAAGAPAQLQEQIAKVKATPAGRPVAIHLLCVDVTRKLNAAKRASPTAVAVLAQTIAPISSQLVSLK